MLLKECGKCNLDQYKSDIELDESLTRTKERDYIVTSFPEAVIESAANVLLHIRYPEVVKAREHEDINVKSRELEDVDATPPEQSPVDRETDSATTTGTSCPSYPGHPTAAFAALALAAGVDFAVAGTVSTSLDLRAKKKEVWSLAGLQKVASDFLSNTSGKITTVLTTVAGLFGAYRYFSGTPSEDSTESSEDESSEVEKIMEIPEKVKSLCLRAQEELSGLSDSSVSSAISNKKDGLLKQVRDQSTLIAVIVIAVVVFLIVICCYCRSRRG